ncbi:ATP-binding protein [Actinoplanes sp. NEAU-A12]|uniref:ATP-binding protein n=1 Tax=Actinoplanes sandaracinus TaxID=3045177 RepID=A0ABT6WGV3_9ACTN|nr:ATP-binding protein [Actinoplanes sandaracinus]MDI6098961.1 ATP-binding protein [Actinoplanes sandaracinus]
MIRNDFDAGVTEVSVHGTWNAELRALTAPNLRACLAETPRAVLVDLSGLVDPAGESVQTWRTAARFAATRRPVSQLVVCAAPEPVRQRLDGTNLRSADSVGDARAAAKTPPWTNRRQLHLPCDLGAAALARDLVADACHDWRMAQMIIPARLIVSELVANAVEHADTDLVAAVSLRGPVLHLAVRDYAMRMPRLIEHDPERLATMIEQRGAGLRLVGRVSTGWGALPGTVGKIVWSTFDHCPGDDLS